MGHDNHVGTSQRWKVAPRVQNHRQQEVPASFHATEFSPDDAQVSKEVESIPSCKPGSESHNSGFGRAQGSDGPYPVVSSMARAALALDGGTESVRAAVIELRSGRVLASHSCTYETKFPKAGWAEQDPKEWWRAVGEASRTVMTKADATVCAVCADTTCCSVVALDENDEAIRPALLWMDVRAHLQAEKVRATGDHGLRVNGQGSVSAEWMLPKALWIKENEPDNYNRALRICEYQDYLMLRMTGKYVGSINTMSVRWHYRAGEEGPPLQMLKALGMESLLDKWPREVVPLGGIIGGLTASAATHMGIPVGTKVVQGGADAFIGMIGMGVVNPGELALQTGSSHLHLGVCATPLHGKGIWGTYANAVYPGKSIIEGGQTSTGSVVNWFRQLLGGQVSYDSLNEEACHIERGSEGLLVLDHFQGNRTPYTDPQSRGAMVGLTLKHGRGHIYRAIIEGICFGTEQILETMRVNGFDPKEMVIAGGSTQSALWVQIHADTSGIPLRLTEVSNAASLGCAILAAYACGEYCSIEAAAEAIVKVKEVVYPDPAGHQEYMGFYRAYKGLYPQLQPLRAGRINQTTLSCRVAPSLLSANPAAFGAEVSRMCFAGADWIHVDICDMEFAGNATIGPSVLQGLRREHPDVFFDCHIAVKDPHRYHKHLVRAGASQVTFHVEAADDAVSLAREIKKLGVRVGLALKPGTKGESAFELLELGLVDAVLFLSVNPGFGGQIFQHRVMQEVKKVREAHPHVDIIVDGGIDASTAAKAAAAGANVLVSGTFVFGADSPARAISFLRDTLVQAHQQ